MTHGASLGDDSQFRLRGKLHRAVRVRVTLAEIARHEGHVSGARWLTWWMARRRACNEIVRIAQTEGTCELQTAALAKQGSEGLALSK